MYRNQLTKTLAIGIVNMRHPFHYESKAVPEPTHALSNTEWNFTGRYRFTPPTWSRGDPHLEIEVKYEVWDSVPRETTGWWDKLWYGSYHMVPTKQTMWVDSYNFDFKELLPTYTYDCTCREPEVTYG